MEDFLNSIKEIHLNDERIIYLGISLLLASFAYFITNRYIGQLVNYVFSSKNPIWRLKATEYKVFRQIKFITPLIFLHLGFSMYPTCYAYVHKYLDAYMVVIISLILTNLVKMLTAIYKTHPIGQKHPLTSYMQLINLILYITGGLTIAAILMDKSPAAVIGGIGALTAVTGFIFKDTLTSFMVSVQIAANNLIEQGDWVEIPSVGANGMVTDISLNFIKIQNWDNSEIYIPTYKISELGFKNWRNMFKVSARRFKAPIFIDHDTIKPLKKPEAEKLLAKITLSQKMDVKILENHALTNLTLFRLYATEYLAQHQDVSKDFRILVRALDSTPTGMPLEISCYTAVTDIGVHEYVRLEIISYLVAIAPLFGLKLFQYHSGLDNN